MSDASISYKLYTVANKCELVFNTFQVQLSVEDGQLILLAQCLEDRDNAVFKKTMIRKIDLPQYVDQKMIHCDLTSEGVLHVEMPFHLPPQRRPVGPSVVPIVDVDGSRRIRLAFNIGPDFTDDDIKIERNDRTLSISAAYDAEIGLYGAEVCQL
jgi:HSP20 family molecular chaperone IbpA